MDKTDLNALREYLMGRLEANHFIKHVGIRLEDLRHGYASLGLDVELWHEQQNGFLHGGMTATLCDVATGIAAYTVVPEGKNVVTADLKISYLNPSVGKRVRTEGSVVKSGNLLYFCEGKVFDCLDEGEKLVATATALMVAVDIPIKH